MKRKYLNILGFVSIINILFQNLALSTSLAPWISSSQGISANDWKLLYGAHFHL